MPKGNHISEFQELVLLALVRLGEKAYGMRVRQEIEARADRHVSIGAVYETLNRLEQKGLVNSHLGASTPQRGGRAKRFFHITASGVSALQECQTTRRRMGALSPAESTMP